MSTAGVATLHLSPGAYLDVDVPVPRSVDGGVGRGSLLDANIDDGFSLDNDRQPGTSQPISGGGSESVEGHARSGAGDPELAAAMAVSAAAAASDWSVDASSAPHSQSATTAAVAATIVVQPSAIAGSVARHIPYTLNVKSCTLTS